MDKRRIYYYCNDEAADFIERIKKLEELYGDVARIRLALSKDKLELDCKMFNKFAFKKYPMEIVMDKLEDVSDIVPFYSIVDLYENYVG